MSPAHREGKVKKLTPKRRLEKREFFIFIASSAVCWRGEGRARSANETTVSSCWKFLWLLFRRSKRRRSLERRCTRWSGFYHGSWNGDRRFSVLWSLKGEAPARGKGLAKAQKGSFVGHFYLRLFSLNILFALFGSIWPFVCSSLCECMCIYTYEYNNYIL